MKINLRSVAMLIFSAILLAGSLPASNAEASTAKTNVYRFYHYSSGSHFYTTSESEKERVIKTMAKTYRYEGNKFYGWTSGNASHRVPVSRFYKLSTKTHFYTISPTETDRLKRDGSFRYEGIAYYGQNDINTSMELSDNEFYGQCILWRFYNFMNGTHFYTASLSEANRIADTMSDRYRDEGLSYIVWSPNCLYLYL